MSEADSAILAELRELRGEVAQMRRAHAAARARHGWLKVVIKDLETNPQTQYKVHLYGVCYWLVNFPLVIGLFFFAPAVWLRLGVFITLIYSIYANAATDYGAMSSALAITGSPLPDIPLEPPPGGARG